jgi:hypothetical protein
MPFRALDPESSVSTNSTTWAGGGLREGCGFTTTRRNEASGFLRSVRSIRHL